MKEQLIKPKTALLAKKKGFLLHQGAMKMYRDEDGHQFDNIGPAYDILDTCSHAPRQTLLQKWLREKHNIDVEIRKCSLLYKRLHENGYSKKCLKYYGVILLESGEDFTIDSSAFTSDVYENVLEKGLYEGLKFITL